jgi:uridine monophosphate synthetase
MIDEIHSVTVELFRIGAVKFGAFRLKLHEKHPEAPLSPIYIDLRVIRSYPSTFRSVVSILGNLAVRFKPDFIADVPTAATPIVGAICAMFDVPMLSPRIAGKEHGIQARLEGVPRRGARAVLIDDLVTSAESKLEVIRVLRSNELTVEDVVVLVDREQGGSEELSRHGCKLHAATTLRDMLCAYVEEQMITATKSAEILSYLESSK